MATAMGTVPASSEANRCWRLCGSRGRQLAVASAKGTGHVYLTGGPEGGISGVGQAARPCYRGLRLFLTCASTGLCLLFMCVASSFSQGVRICSGDQEHTGGRAKARSEPAVLRLCFPFPSLELNLKATP